MIYRTRIFKIVLSKLYIVSKDANVFLMIMWPPKTQLFYHNASDMLLLADKHTLCIMYCMWLKSYYLLEKLISPLLIFLCLLSILPFLLSPLVLLSYSLNPHGGYVKSDNHFLQFLYHMTSDVKFLLVFYLPFFIFVQKLHSIN